jgi:glycosidase
MHLIMDWVANHTAADHPWTRARPEFYTRDSATGAILPPAGTDWTDVADLDYASPALHDSMAAAMRYWVETFDVDGFRCDVAAMVPREFWARTTPMLREVRPLLMLAEAEEPWVHEVGFDLSYGWNTYNALRAVWGGAPGDTLAAVLDAERAAYPPRALRLRFVTNHDETSWQAAAVEMWGGVDGSRAAMTVAAALPGIPLLYNGQEVAAPQRLNLFEDEEIDWSGPPGLREYYVSLLSLVRNSRAVREGSMTWVPVSADGVLAFAREAAGERVLVVVNARAEPREVRFPPDAGGRAMQEVGSGTPRPDSLTLPPHGVRIYRGLAAAGPA